MRLRFRLNILSVEFLGSASDASTLPHDSVPEVVLVGRSNVGKSSLINALLRRRIARTSAAPGRTRLINSYGVRVASGPHRGELRIIDLPGYGYARGGAGSARAFAALVEGYFAAPRRVGAVLLLVDARHPGLEPDRAALAWLRGLDRPCLVVATKVDQLARARRPRAMRELHAAMDARILPVSAVSGEGLNALWTHISRLVGLTPPRTEAPPSWSSRPSRI